MDIPSAVIVTCPMADMKKIQATLIAISPLGYYEVHVNFGSNTHLVLLPIADTVLTTAEPILRPPPGFDVER